MTMAFIAALIMQDCGLAACPVFSSVKIFGFTQVIECPILEISGTTTIEWLSGMMLPIFRRCSSGIFASPFA
jgi:hypothetical protein